MHLQYIILLMDFLINNNKYIGKQHYVIFIFYKKYIIAYNLFKKFQFFWWNDFIKKEKVIVSISNRQSYNL